MNRHGGKIVFFGRFVAVLTCKSQPSEKNIQDLGESVGDMASRQYERAQDAASDVLQETVGAIRRNPFAAIGSVGFLYGVIKG